VMAEGVAVSSPLRVPVSVAMDFAVLVTALPPQDAYVVERRAERQYQSDQERGDAAHTA
jgi:hypothetical protein